MRTEYRNATRSKSLIKKAFIDLLKEKPACKVTVTDIIHEANISRGTFYAHYLDTKDLLESFQREFIEQILYFTRKNHKLTLVEQLNTLLMKILDILKNDYETYCILSNQDFTFEFYNEMRDAMIQELQQEFSLSPETKRRLHIFIGGFMILLREWLQNGNFESMEEYAHTMSDLILHNL